MYLSLNGVTVRVAVDSVSLRYVGASGEEERSPSGSLEGGPLVLKREWAMATTPVHVSEVDAWVGLIEGKGHSWPFDADFYSTRGRGPSTSVGASIVTSLAKHGAGRLNCGLGAVVDYNAGLSSTWTVMLWRGEAGVWRHYLITSGGAKWKDGVRNDALVTDTFLEVVGGTVQLGDIFSDGSGDDDFDGLVALPYVVPDAWATAMYTQHNSAAWSALPSTLAAGAFATSSVTVRGKVTDSRVIRYSPSGTLPSGHTIQFTLQEV
jgi:hypothetical protein